MSKELQPIPDATLDIIAPIDYQAREYELAEIQAIEYQLQNEG